jgi:hypothetical protein
MTDHELLCCVLSCDTDFQNENDQKVQFILICMNLIYKSRKSFPN